jgi:two-component system chemotaxis sensor kinase CheA
VAAGHAPATAGFGPAAAPAAAPPPAAPAEGATLRVPVDKIDLLLNQVGELVVTQSMLQQLGAALDPAARQQLEPVLGALQRHARDLQDTVMAVRMVPVGTLFARFPRLVRELAAQLGKRVDLRLEGESTELDKGMVERIVDPLTHLVRNALDHGIEAPAERRTRGKPEAGRLTLAAAHEGTSVIVTVRDDGAGLSRPKLLAKARERGLATPDGMSDTQVWALIFAPGFSTAAAVTEVSGRGVGMDVVQRNVAALGGSIEIDAAEGRGMAVRVRLPLTLAILDAMLVRVADECYVLPLAAVVESFRPEDATAGRIAGQRIVRLRDAVLPVLVLQALFDVPAGPEAAGRKVLVAVEADGGRVALEVDELLGQQQVVVKNLLANCGPVPHVSAATVLGDGRVALILDVGSLVRLARRDRVGA